MNLAKRSDQYIATQIRLNELNEEALDFYKYDTGAILPEKIYLDDRYIWLSQYTIMIEFIEGPRLER